MILEFLSNLFGIEDDINLKKLAVNKKIQGGLELILPGMYYDIMKSQQKLIIRDEL